MPLLSGVTEIILYVEDMQQMVSFYRDTLDLEILFPEGLEDYSSENWVAFKTGQCSLALHSGGKRRQGADAPKFVFAVLDFESAKKCLEEKSVVILNERSPAPGLRVADARDLEGNYFSIEERRG